MKYLLLQTLFIILLLSVFAVADYGLNQQYQDTASRIEALPLVVFSHDWNMLRELSVELYNFQQIRELKLERNVEILEKMIMNYELPAADRIIDIDRLPNKLEFSFDGEKTDRELYETVKETIRDKQEDLMLISRNEEFFNLFDIKVLNTYIRQIMFAATLLFLFLITLIMQSISIRRKNFFWKIYYRSGGKESRLKSFSLQSIIASLLPPLIFTALLFLSEKYLGLTYLLDLNSWIIIIGIVFITCPTAWLITDKYQV